MTYVPNPDCEVHRYNMPDGRCTCNPDFPRPEVMQYVQEIEAYLSQIKANEELSPRGDHPGLDFATYGHAMSIRYCAERLMNLMILKEVMPRRP